MKSVGGDDFNQEAVLSPLVQVLKSDSAVMKMHSMNQMVNFLNVVFDDREDDKFDYKNKDIRPKAIQFLKIRLSVLKKMSEKASPEQFSVDCLKVYTAAKQSI